MTMHSSATAHVETSQATESVISDALRRRAQAVIDDVWIDPQWRSIIRYALETSDPFLADLVRRADAREVIVDAIDFSQTPETNEDDSIEEKIETLAEIISGAGDQSAAALFVLMGTLENSSHPKLLANTAKHFAFARCAELDLYGIVDAQIGLVEAELLAPDASTS